MESFDQLSSTLSALADPNRRAMLARLARGEADVGELGAPLGISQPAVSKHLKVLERAGLVTVRPSGQRRLRALVPEPFNELGQWLDAYRSQWENRFKRLDLDLAATAPAPPDEEKEDKGEK